MERKLVLRVLLRKQKQSDVMVICALYSQKSPPHTHLPTAVGGSVCGHWFPMGSSMFFAACIIIIQFWFVKRAMVSC